MVFHYRETNHNWFYSRLSPVDEANIIRHAKLKAAHELADMLIGCAKVEFNHDSHCVKVVINTEKLVSDE